MLKYIIALTAAIGLSACHHEQTEIITPNPVVSAGLEAWQDPVATLTTQPSSQATLTYSDTSDFHRALNASMRGRVPVIAVSIPANRRLPLEQFTQDRSQLDRSAPGLVRWTARIRNTGGHIMACSDQETEVWAQLIPLIFQIAAPWVNDALTYRPANQYNAVAFVDSDDNREPVTQIKFVRRDAHDIQALSCRDAHGL
jgi:hypothetical protein